MGDTGTGKTSLVNCLKARPMKLSGAEQIAGYCIYNEKMLIEVDNSDQSSSSDEAASSLENQESSLYNLKLQITEIRNYKTYGGLVLKEAFRQPVIGPFLVMCIDLTKRSTLTNVEEIYMKDLKHISQPWIGLKVLIVGTKSDLL